MSNTKIAYKTYIAERIIDSFKESSEDSMFLFISRPTSWGGSDTPPDFVDSTESFFDTYRRATSAKKITVSDAYLMATKNEWTSGTVYTQYADDIDLSSSAFYVINSENNVYKCLFNNSGGSSIVSPMGAISDSFTLSDGYIWKFLFRIPENYVRWITDTDIPLRNLKIETGVETKYSDERQLQYSVQYNAVDGAIDIINVADQGDIYTNSVLTRVGTSDDTTVVAVGTTTSTIQIKPSESSTDNAYNGYNVYISRGTGLGQLRGLTGYNGTNNTATVTSNWSVIPDGTSYYEIMPQVSIDGDGISAEARTSVDSGLKINNTFMMNRGSGYTRATAVVTTGNGGNGATLDPVIGPYSGHGADPTSEIMPTKVLIISALNRGEETNLPASNEFRQYGILKNPIINETYTGAGKVAGSEVDTITEVKMNAATGSQFSHFSFLPQDVFFGTESKACGEVDTFDTMVDKSKGRARLKNVGSNFIVNEKLIALGTAGTDSSGDVWTSSNKPVAYFTFQENTASSQTINNYRMATKITVSPTGGNSQGVYSDATWSEDMGITGANGSSSTLVSWTNSGVSGGTAELWVTNVLGTSSAGEYGFTAGESIWPGGVPSGSYETYINTIEPSQFVLGSGKILYINNVAPIDRHNEQSEELKLTIDLGNC
jgi:hypothetical protein